MSAINGMKSSMTQQRLRELVRYDPDTGVLYREKVTGGKVKVGDVVGSSHSEGYIECCIGTVKDYAHRFIWLYVYGHWPRGTIDHINRNRSDNRLCNLREATYTENNHNKSISKNNTSGCPGVYWSERDGKHRVQITIQRKNIYIGSFKCKEEAIAARKAAESKYYSTFAGETDD